MKSLFQFILENHGVSKDIDILTNYIFNVLKDDVYKDNEKNPKISWLYQQCKDYNYDFYPIEINFSDIKGFNQNNYNLLTYRKMEGDYKDYDCDMIVNVSKMNEFGQMDTDEPMLLINSKYIKTKNTFEKNKVNILNTIAHELTHYVQHMANDGKHKLKSTDGSIDRLFAENIKDNMRYYICNFLLYVLNPIEMDARRQGFYQTIKMEIKKRMKEWKKLHKDESFDKDNFCKYCMYHDDYHNNVLHMKYFDLFEDAIKDDSWEDYQKCFNDKNDKYRDDSIIYVLLNICDTRTTKPHLPMPSKKNFVMHINNEKRFNEYKDKLLRHYKENIDKHKQKLKRVIELVLEENNIIKGNS